MSKRQRAVLATAFVLLLLAAIIPPWRQGYDRLHAWDERFVGHRFIVHELWFRRDSRIRIDAGLLLAETLVIVSATGLLLVVWREPSR